MDVVPGEIRLLVKSCLEKDPKKRLRDLGDAWRIVAPRQQVARELPSVSKSRWPWSDPRLITSLAVAGALVVVGVRHGRPRRPRSAAACREAGVPLMPTVKEA